MSDELTSGASPVPAAPSAPPTAPAAPTAPASTQADSRPTIDSVLDQSFASATGEPAAPTETQPSPTAPAPTPAITEPPPGQTAPESTQGPIPFDRHKAAVENARTKGAHEAEQRLQQQFQQQYGPAIQVVDQLRANLPATAAQIFREGLRSPEHRDGVRAELGRLFNELRQEARANGQQGQPQVPIGPDDPEPQRYVDVNGEQYFDPQADRKWQDWNNRRLEQALEKKFQPLTGLQARLEKAQAIAQIQQQAQQTVSQRLQFWQDQPGFTDHKKAIAARQKELFERGDMDEWTALGLAYAQVVPPLLQAKQTNQWVQEAGRKSAASTANPTASAPAQPRRGKTVDETLDLLYEHLQQR